MMWLNGPYLDQVYAACATPVYANHHAVEVGGAALIDCDLGTNPLGASRHVCRALGCVGLDDVAPYPPAQADDLARVLIDYWGIRGLPPEQMVFGSGSIDVLTTLLRILPQGTTIVGPSPQFTSLPVAGVAMGLAYQPVRLAAHDYDLRPEVLLGAVKPGVGLVYLDRPHNPTGQVMPLDDVARLARRCGAVGCLLLVDEAYGEYLDEEDSALTLEHPNLVVVRTFSKGFGLAGARLGYAAVREPRLAHIYRYVHPPFAASSLGIRMARVALEDRGFLALTRRYVRQVRPLTDRALGGAGMRVAPSHAASPIVLIEAERGDVVAQLAQAGIAVTPGLGFLDLSERFARLRVPAPRDLGGFLDRLGASLSADGARAVGQALTPCACSGENPCQFSGTTGPGGVPGAWRGRSLSGLGVGAGGHADAE
jgi:histidinol-phosphate aminotransferase